jgi:hypothetical protein
MFLASGCDVLWLRSDKRFVNAREGSDVRRQRENCERRRKAQFLCYIFNYVVSKAAVCFEVVVD